MLAVAGLLASLGGVAEWSLGLMAAMVGAIVADSAQHLARRSRLRARRAAMARETDRAAREIRERYRERHGTRRDAA